MTTNDRQHRPALTAEAVQALADLAALGHDAEALLLGALAHGRRSSSESLASLLNPYDSQLAPFSRLAWGEGYEVAARSYNRQEVSK